MFDELADGNFKVSKKQSKSEDPQQADDPAPDSVTDAVRRVLTAREQLRRAEEELDRARRQERASSDAEPTTTLDVVVARVLEWVSRHPGSGIIGAALVGILVGRGTRR